MVHLRGGAQPVLHRGGGAKVGWWDVRCNLERSAGAGAATGGVLGSADCVRFCAQQQRCKASGQGRTVQSHCAGTISDRVPPHPHPPSCSQAPCGSLPVPLSQCDVTEGAAGAALSWRQGALQPIGVMLWHKMPKAPCGAAVEPLFTFFQLGRQHMGGVDLCVPQPTAHKARNKT